MLRKVFSRFLLSDLKQSGLKQSGLKPSDLKDSDPKNSDKNTDPKNSDFKNSDLKHSDAKYSDLKHSDSKYSDPKYSDPKHSDPKNSDLKNSDFKNSDLKHSDAKYSDPKNSDLKNSDPKHSDLKNSDPKHSDLKNSDPKHSDLKHLSVTAEGTPTGVKVTSKTSNNSYEITNPLEMLISILPACELSALRQINKDQKFKIKSVKFNKVESNYDMSKFTAGGPTNRIADIDLEAQFETSGTQKELDAFHQKVKSSCPVYQTLLASGIKVNSQWKNTTVL